jgi:hypothetical protein
MLGVDFGTDQKETVRKLGGKQKTFPESSNWKGFSLRQTTS